MKIFNKIIFGLNKTNDGDERRDEAIDVQQADFVVRRKVRRRTAQL